MLVGKHIQLLQIKFISFNGYQQNIIQVPKFAAMFQAYDPKFQPISCLTYVAGVSSLFLKMLKGIKSLVADARCDLGKLDNWLSICHDLWTSINTNGILGSSIKLTTSDMESHTIACTLKKHNDSHAAEHVAQCLQEVYEERFGIDLSKEAGFVASDTTPCAHNVGEKLGSIQNDYTMHITSLIINYSVGW